MFDLHRIEVLEALLRPKPAIYDDLISDGTVRDL